MDGWFSARGQAIEYHYFKSGGGSAVIEYYCFNFLILNFLISNSSKNILEIPYVLALSKLRVVSDVY